MNTEQSVSDSVVALFVGILDGLAVTPTRTIKCGVASAELRRANRLITHETSLIDKGALFRNRAN